MKHSKLQFEFLQLMALAWWAAFIPAIAVANPLHAGQSTVDENGVDETVSPRQETDNAPSEEEITQENRSDWEFYAVIDTSRLTDPSAEGSEFVQFTILPGVFGRSRPDLADLRVVNSSGQPIAYSLRTLAPKTIRDTVAFRKFDESTAASGVHEFSLELTGNVSLHNEIKIATVGRDFRRKVELERSDDGREWERLAAGYLIHFGSESSQYQQDTLHYSTTRARFLRIRIYPDAEKSTQKILGDSIGVSEVSVFQTVTLAGQRSDYAATLEKRQPTRHNGVAASSWLIDLGESNVPCNRLQFDVADSEFVRDIELEIEDSTNILGQPVFRNVYSIERQTWDRKKGESKFPLTIDFDESYAKRYRLIVYDYRNTPLTITSAVASGDRRQVILPKTESLSNEIRLYFGNPNADIPNYDFSRGLPAKLDAVPTSIGLGDILSNPDFVPPPVPLTERYPWLVYAVMFGVCTLLLLIIFGLANRAIKIHEETA